jgi:hypothetical protein
MESKPPPGAPQPPPIVPVPPVPAEDISKPPLRLGIGPILVVATIALAAGFLIGKHASDSDGSPASKADGVAPAVQGDVATLQGKSSDAEAKAAVVTAAEAMETCATDNQGSYANCGSDDLAAVEPTLADLGDRLNSSASATTYKLSVEAANTSNEFTLQRAANGTTARFCTDAGSLGCASGGVW